MLSEVHTGLFIDKMLIWKLTLFYAFLVLISYNNVESAPLKTNSSKAHAGVEKKAEYDVADNGNVVKMIQRFDGGNELKKDDKEQERKAKAIPGQAVQFDNKNKDVEDEERMNADEPGVIADTPRVRGLLSPKSANIKENVLKMADIDGTKTLLSSKNQVRRDESLNVKERISLEDLQLPDHVDGLRVEHDGHLNRDYKKEILLGEEHKEFDDEPGNQKLLSRLKIIFNKADANHDGYLVKDELEAWILEKVEEHLREALRENNRIFSHLDTDRDGYVTWKEFQKHFLLAQGHDQEKLEEHGEDYEKMKLETSDREKIVRYKFRWAEADVEPQDDRLNREEMKNFRHPEQSPQLIERMAKDIIENLDENEDGIITEEEFVSLPRHGDRMHEEGMEGEDLNIVAERRKEFRNVIDLNRDGKVTIQELKVYVDPHNAQHAQLEAENLIQLADDNHDSKLSIDEVLNNAELFFGSKIVNVGFNFHDEF